MIKKQKLCDGCGRFSVIWKNISTEEGRKKLCQWCASQLTEHKPTKRSTQLASRSPKRQKEEGQYNKKAKKFKEDNPLCQIGIVGVCTHFTNDVHHEGGRENHLLLKEEWWRATCRACHKWVGVNTQEAIELGFSRQRTTNSDDNENNNIYNSSQDR